MKKLYRITFTNDSGTTYCTKKLFRIVKETRTRFRIMHKIRGIEKYEWVKKAIVNTFYKPSILNNDERYKWQDWYIWATKNKLKSIMENFNYV